MVSCRLCGSENRSSSCHCSTCGEILQFGYCIHGENARWGLDAIEVDAAATQVVKRSKLENRIASLDQLLLF